MLTFSVINISYGPITIQSSRSRDKDVLLDSQGRVMLGNQVPLLSKADCQKQGKKFRVGVRVRVRVSVRVGVS